MPAAHSIAVCAEAQAVREFRIIPAGEFWPNDGRPLAISWRLTPERGAQLVAQADQRTMDYLIDYEHQTLYTEKNGQPAPAAGWFKKLEMRADGLYAVDARWTAAAKGMIQGGEYRYLSPVFRFDSVTGEVLALDSLALTNNPALHGLTDLKDIAVNSAQNPQTEAPVEYMSDRSREAFVATFGMTPEVAAAAGQQEHQAALAAQTDCGMSAKDRATLEHVFGATPEALAEMRRQQDYVPPAPDGMNAEDWAKFRHVFGDVLNGR